MLPLKSWKCIPKPVIKIMMKQDCKFCYQAVILVCSGYFDQARAGVARAVAISLLHTTRSWAVVRQPLRCLMIGRLGSSF